MPCQVRETRLVGCGEALVIYVTVSDMELVKLVLEAFSEWISSASNGAILLSALIAFLGALGALRHQRKIARERVTFELVRAAETQEFSRFVAGFHKASTKDGVLAKLPYEMDPDTHGWAEKNNVLCILNHYELIALAAKKCVIDEKFYREWIGPDYVNDWEVARPFILAMRERDNDQRSYIHFQRLAVKWGGTPLPKTKQMQPDDVEKKEPAK